MKFRSPVYSAVSGSLAGQTFAHNAGGMYVRARATPVNAHTSQQNAVRNAIAQFTNQWATILTTTQRTAWSVFSGNMPVPDKFGVPRIIPALSWFVKCNVPRQQAGATTITNAPTIWELAFLTLPTPTVTAATANVSFAFNNADPWATEVGGYLFIYASPPQSPGINFYNGPYRYAGKISGAVSPPTSPASVTMPYVPGPTGSKMFFRFVSARADGRPSSPYRIQAIAA